MYNISLLMLTYTVLIHNTARAGTMSSFWWHRSWLLQQIQWAIELNTRKSTNILQGSYPIADFVSYIYINCSSYKSQKQFRIRYIIKQDSLINTYFHGVDSNRASLQLMMYLMHWIEDRRCLVLISYSPYVACKESIFEQMQWAYIFLINKIDFELYTITTYFLSTCSSLFT